MKTCINKVIAYVLVFMMVASMTTAMAPVKVSAATETLALTSDKTTYTVGENIVVTAAGGETGADKAWVGIYKKGDKPGSGSTSIYWYYMNNGTSASASNKPVILQEQQQNSGSLTAGQYEIHLFKNSGYTILKTIEITIVGNNPEDQPAEGDLVSISYKLDNKKDGFANGTVTIEADSDRIIGADCVMYWADGEGNPLEDYTPLAKFRLTGATTVHEMYDYTIIPEGAETLIAYKSVSDEQVGEPVMTELPEDCNYVLEDDYNVEFQLISDIHIRTEENHIHNTHFNQMLADVEKNSPDSIGIFVNGDIADNGLEAQYEKLVSLYNEANSAGNLPKLHISIGNHDWYDGNPSNQFQKYVKILNPALKEQLETIYYHEEIAGYNFIFLGSESAGGYATLSAAQLTWFDNLMKDITAEDPEKPVFVLLHQPLKDTVAGTLPGQGWHGVNNEQALRDILKKYDQIIIAGGHSHWELDSVQNMYSGDDNMSVAVNTASVAYLWTSYNIVTGENAPGSNGYFVRVYDDKVVFLGRDIENQRYVSSAIFVVEKNHIDTPTDLYKININEGKTKLNAEFADDNNVKFKSSDESVVKVSSLGTLTPVSEGTAQINITAYATEKYVKNYKTVDVTVVDEPVTPDEPGTEEPDPDDPGTDEPAPHVHAMSEWYEVTAPGCETEGINKRNCDGCEYTETESVEPAGHTEVIDKAVAPTCTETGLTEGKHCAVCDNVLVAQQTVAVKDHVWTEWDITDSTCTEKGNKVRKCKNCAEEENATIPVKGHDYMHLTPVAPTCTETGLTGGTVCRKCGDVYAEQKIISETGHKYGDWLIEKHATCTDAGTEIKVCEICKNTQRQSVSAAGHTYDTFTKVDEKASTADAGKIGTYRYCTECQDITDARLMTTSSIRKISNIRVSKDKFTYTGNVCVPEITVKNSVGIKLENGVDYDISVINADGKAVEKSVAAGSYNLKVSFKGNYEGVEEFTYTILPKETKINKLVSGKKQFTVKWAKKTAQVTGYQIRYSTKMNMNGAKTILVNKAVTSSKIIKKLKSKQRYYVQIRTYKTVNGVKYYSSWSAKKNIRTK